VPRWKISLALSKDPDTTTFSAEKPEELANAVATFLDDVQALCKAAGG